MTALFLCTAFLSAALLFWIQPMVGKMLLPALGGAPAVWNTCLVFFQAMLLGGYLYAHLLTGRFSIRAQAMFHFTVASLGMLALPVFVDAHGGSAPSDGAPTMWLLGMLTAAAAGPFFILSATAPLLQRWFSASDHPRSDDPYFFYAASNAGSLAGLLAYPLVAEPLLELRGQSELWSAGFLLFSVLIGACGLTGIRREADPEAHRPAALGGELALSDAGGWLYLAALPSSLSLGITTHLTTNFAAFPLLWVVPLGLYLLTFVIAFAPGGFKPRAWMRRAYALPATALIVAFIVGADHPAWLMTPAIVAVFFFGALLCHGELAARRPEPRHLTMYFLVVSVGGVLGGAFNTFIAPLMFSNTIEYPLVLALIAGVIPVRGASGRISKPELVRAPLGVLIGGLLLLFAVAQSGIPEGRLSTLLIFAPLAVFAYSHVRRPRAFCSALLVLVLLEPVYARVYETTLYQSRNFFGILRVVEDRENHFIEIVHGDTIHGRQRREDRGSCIPSGYYTPMVPIGQIMLRAQEVEQPRAPARIAVAGLGAGGMACFATALQQWIFYEINPAVEAVARDDRLFTFLKLSKAAALEVLLGDARLELMRAPDGYFDIIVVDAFSSDSIPTHLITREALQLYRSKLAPHGIIVFHISNRRLDLRPLLGTVGAAEGLIVRVQNDLSPTEQDAAIGKLPSIWTIAARSEEDLAAYADFNRWIPLPPDPSLRVWTDAYSNILSVVRWD